MTRSSATFQSSNRIAGEACPAASGVSYELRDPGVRGEGAGEHLGRWPRSGEEDVRRALDAAHEAAAAWHGLRAHERGERLRRVGRALGAHPDGDGRAGRVLGLTASELMPHALGLEGKFSAAVREGLTRMDAPGITLIRPHWSQLWAGLGQVVLAELAAGRCVIVLPGPEAPVLADRLAEGLERAELPPGVFALLHDDGRTALRAAVEQVGGERLHLCAAAEEEGHVRAWLDGREYSPKPGRRARPVLPFGSGIDGPVQERPELVFVGLRTSAVRIGAEDDVEDQARRVVLAALGRSPSLSGQLPGHVRLVRCHPARLSEFTAALLERLEDDPELLPPVPPLGRDQMPYLETIHGLGVAEGATLIHEGTCPRSRKGSRGAILGPLVFTNVEPGMRLAQASRPAPVLLLTRSSS